MLLTTLFSQPPLSALILCCCWDSTGVSNWAAAGNGRQPKTDPSFNWISIQWPSSIYLKAALPLVWLRVIPFSARLAYCAQPGQSTSAVADSIIDPSSAFACSSHSLYLFWHWRTPLWLHREDYMTVWSRRGTVAISTVTSLSELSWYSSELKFRRRIFSPNLFGSLPTSSTPLSFARAFEVPILLIVIFEITYLVHKRRSVNFCLMYFDEGVRVKNTAFMSFLLRNSIRTLALALLLLSLIAEFQLYRSESPLGECLHINAPQFWFMCVLFTSIPSTQDERAGTAGWWTLFHEEWVSFRISSGFSILINYTLKLSCQISSKQDESSITLLISLIPTAILTVVSFYLSIMLWRSVSLLSCSNNLTAYYDLKTWFCSWIWMSYNDAVDMGQSLLWLYTRVSASECNLASR